MSIKLDAKTASAVFTLPQSSGAFDPDFFAYLRELGQRRRSVILAFAPKAAGTYLRSAAIGAIGGQLMRIVHAYGGREAQPYLPTFLRYFAGDANTPTMVTHVHMQALPANRHFFEALDLKPIIMLRSVPDMLCSLLDMLNSEPITPELWINNLIPENFTRFDEDEQADFIVDVMAPWYASYFANWLEFAQASPSRVCILRYPEFKRDPVSALRTLLRHSGLECTNAQCERALDVAWNERALFRFNKGEHGRGIARFQDRHIARVETLLFRHYGLSSYRKDLLPESI
jgi:hypothetical protein